MSERYCYEFSAKKLIITSFVLFTTLLSAFQFIRFVYTALSRVKSSDQMNASHFAS